MVDESKQLQGNKDGDKHQTQELTNTSGNSQPSAPTPAQVPSVQQQQQQDLHVLHRVDPINHNIHRLI